MFQRPPFKQKGRVVRAEPQSFAGLTKCAKEVEAKGVFIDRGGAHAHEAEIIAWLETIEEEDLPYGEFAGVQVLVAPEKECDDSSCDEDHGADQAPPLATAAEIREACKALVADLPESFRGAVEADAAALVKMSRKLCPETPWITMRLEVVQLEACWRWHQDFYTARTLCCYVGPGTHCCDDKSVDWDTFEATMDEESNLECVPESKIKTMQTNAVLLMKGDSWPGIRGTGLTHKSPSGFWMGPDAPKRLILKVDLNDMRPPLADDPDGDGESEEGDEGDFEEGDEEDEDEEDEDDEEDDRPPPPEPKRQRRR